eukprot:tig00000215_g18646.t1
MSERTAKRARAEEASVPASSSSSTSAAAAKACASGEGVNHFARLPDELVRRIFGELEATEAYETCQLWSLDRRFRQIMRGVHWPQLRVEPCREPTAEDSLAICTAEYRKRVERVTARVQSGALAGCRRLVVGPALAGGHAAVGSKESVEACIRSTVAMAKMLGALSVAPARLEDVCFSAHWMGWPWPSRQSKLGIDKPQALDDVVGAFLTALRPAPLRALRLEDFSIFWSFTRVAAMGCLPNLQELSFEQTYLTNVTKETTSKLVKLWSGLKKIACNVKDGEALRVLSQLPLEELRATAYSCAGVEEALEAFKTDSVRALHLPSHAGVKLPAAPRLLASLLRLRNLEELSIAVDNGSGEALAGLGALQKLRSLRLLLMICGDAPAGDVGLLRAAAAGLEALPRLDSLYLQIAGLDSHVGAPPGPEPGDLASLIRAGRPSLRELKVWARTPASTELLGEVARAGPKLEEVRLCQSADGVDELGVYSELLGMPAADARAPGFNVHVVLFIPEPIHRQVLAILRGYLKGRKLPVRFDIRTEAEALEVLELH